MKVISTGALLFMAAFFFAACENATMSKFADADITAADTDAAADTTVADTDAAVTDTDGTIPDDAEDVDTTRPDDDTLDAVCIEHWDCSEGMFCKRGIGSCGDPGVCTLIPLNCDELWAPVCGCDGMTYANECTANAGSHNIAYDGECQPGKLCVDTADCDPDEYCLTTGGMCGGEGTCTPYPDAECSDTIDLVCGCDGSTYNNYCYAQANGESIAHWGPCGSMITCTTNKQCTETEYCAKDLGVCDDTTEGGCDLRPVDCELISALILVCGCDNVTYNHPCFAYAAGVNLMHEGACEGEALCLTNDDCGQTEFCKKDIGVCDTGSGSCELRPENCPMPPIAAPVCGCDGLDYSDECNANIAGQNVDFSGACADAIPKSSLNYGYHTDATPQVTAHILVAKSAEETIEYSEATVVEKVNTGLTDIILRVTYGNVATPVPGQENVIVQLSLPRTSNVPYAVAIDGGENYVRWLDAVGNTKVDLVGTVNITAYETDNNFPDYTVTGLEFVGDGLMPKQ